LDKVQEQMQRLQIAAEVYLELGGDDHEPAAFTPPQARAKRVEGKGRAQPLLVVRKREEAVAEAQPKPPRKRTVRRGSHVTARDTVLKIFLAADNKPMTSGEVAEKWPGRVALVGTAKQPMYQALHEGKKLGWFRFNEEERRYALSEAGLRMAHGRVGQANAAQRGSEAA